MYKNLKERFGFNEDFSRKQPFDWGNSSNLAEVGEVLKDNSYSYPQNRPIKKIRTIPKQDDKYYAEEIEKVEKISIKTTCIVILCTILGSILLAYVVWAIVKFLYNLPITIF